MINKDKDLLPLDQFEQLSKEEKVEHIRSWRLNYRIRDIVAAWNLDSSTNYYTVLKKNKIYDLVVRENKKFGVHIVPPIGRGLSENDNQEGAFLPERRPIVRRLNGTYKVNEIVEWLNETAGLLQGRKNVKVYISIVSD